MEKIKRTQCNGLKCVAACAAFFVLPSFGSSMRMDVLGEVSVSEPQGQASAQMRAGFVAVESMTFPHHFAIDPGADTLVFKNESTGKTIGLSCKGFGDSVEVTPLLWRELTNDGMGKGQQFSWSCGSVTNNQMMAMTAWQTFKPDAASIDPIELPIFNFKDNGLIRSTGTTNRTLVAVSKLFPFKRMTLPGVAVDEPDESELRFFYTYELPDGRESAIVDGEGTMPTESAVVNVDDGSLPFQINYTDSAGEGFYDPTHGAQRRAAMEYAVAKWGESLVGTVPVIINASIDSLDPGILGQCGPLAVGVSEPRDREFEHVNTVYVSGLANQLLGYDFATTTADIQVTFASDYIDDFYFGTDGNCPYSQVDFVTIVLHELTHGLGFIDGIDSDGSFWYGGDPFVFDHSLYYNGSLLVDLDQTTRATAITSQALYWDGVNAKAANGDARIEMYAPSTYSGGSSVAHWDDYIPFVSFMEHAYVDVIHTIDGQLLGAMQDMEWTLADIVPADSDGDGIPDEWETLYFGSSTGADPAADPDGDGADNLAEYISGYDPTDPSSVFKATSFTPPATSGAPFIINWDSVEGRIYNVGWNYNLQYGSFTNISGDLPYPANSYTDEVNRATGQNFYRVDVRLDQ